MFYTSLLIVKADWLICYKILNDINSISVLIALALFGEIRVNEKDAL